MSGGRFFSSWLWLGFPFCSEGFKRCIDEAGGVSRRKRPDPRSSGMNHTYIATWLLTLTGCQLFPFITLVFCSWCFSSCTWRKERLLKRVIRASRATWRCGNNLTTAFSSQPPRNSSRLSLWSCKYDHCVSSVTSRECLCILVPGKYVQATLVPWINFSLSVLVRPVKVKHIFWRRTMCKKVKTFLCRPPKYKTRQISFLQVIFDLRRAEMPKEETVLMRSSGWNNNSEKNWWRIHSQSTQEIALRAWLLAMSEIHSLTAGLSSE